MSSNPPTRPAEGLFTAPRPVDTVADLLANVWQFGYVTTDLDRAMDMLATRFGLEHCVTVTTEGSSFSVGEQPAQWEARFAMGARGGPIVEVIEPLSGAVDFYRRFLPSDGSFAVRFHHVAAFVPTGEEEWERLRGILAREGLRFRLHGGHPRPRAGRLRGHQRRARPSPGDLPAAVRGPGLLQRAGRRQRLTAADPQRRSRDA